jgi:hypothetical protein
MKEPKIVMWRQGTLLIAEMNILDRMIALIECDCGERWSQAPRCYQTGCHTAFPLDMVRRRDFINKMNKI